MSDSMDIAQVADIARIALSADEQRTLAAELTATLDYLQQLQTVALAQVPPTIYGNAATATLRDDVAVPALAREQFWSNAPDCTETEFKLPKIVEDA